MRIAATNALLACAIALGCLHFEAAIAQQPASPAQISAWQSQKAALENQKNSLQAQQQTDRGEIERLRVGQQNADTRIAQLTAEENLYASIQKNPAAAVGQAWATGKSPGEVIAEALTRNVDVRNKLGELRQFKAAFSQREAELRTNIARRDAEIANVENQIAQLDRTIAYYSNPRQGDLENERARLKNLEAQKKTADDAGQLGWDIENTRRRIRELEGQFQGAGSAPTSGSYGAPSQGGYNAPATGPGSGTPSQLPPGYGPVYGGGGYVPGPGVPNYRQLQQNMPQHGAGAGNSGWSGSSGMPSPGAGGGMSSPAGGNAPATGGTCGPGTSCSCSGGRTGHIPCDSSMGACHCSGG